MIFPDRLYIIFILILCLFFSACRSVQKADDGAIPAVNQLGYLPGARKYFCLPAAGLSGNEPFQVIDSRSGNAVFEGLMENPPFDDTVYSGTRVYRGFFSELSAPGEYIVRVSGRESEKFTISNSIYQGLFRDSFRTLYLVRANIPHNDAVTGLTHASGHKQDFDINGRDFSGGWYNAGDYGKWTHCSSIVVANLLWLYTLSEHARGDNLNIPESGNGIPDLLDEARWGLDWLLKMQNDDGSVYHKIDTEPLFAWGKGPDEDHLERTEKWTDRNGNVPSSIDAADFCAACSLAARVFDQIDAVFSETCRQAALLSWAWLSSNPDNSQTDPYYTETDPAQEIYWAAAEMFALTGGEQGSELIRLYAQPRTNPPGWQTPDFYGTLALVFEPSVPDEIRSGQRDALFSVADGMIKTAASHAYGHVLTDFWWGSNSYVMGAAQLLSAAYFLSHKEKYKNCALEQMNYLLGCNALNLSFITGYGGNSVQNPYHWIYFVYGIKVPGWIAGGANRMPDGVDPLLESVQKKGTPPALCFVDKCSHTGSWASNEGTVDMTSALVFLAGFYSALK